MDLDICYIKPLRGPYSYIDNVIKLRVLFFHGSHTATDFYLRFLGKNVHCFRPTHIQHKVKKKTIHISHSDIFSYMAAILNLFSKLDKQ